MLPRDYLGVRSFGVIWIRINDPRSLGSWYIKGTDESSLVTDSSVPLMHQYPFARTRGHSRPCSLKRDNSGRRIETRRESRNSVFENETTFVFITPRSRANLTLKKKIFIMPGHYKKILPAQQPIRARVLL